MYLHVLAPDDKRQRISLSFTDMRISRVMASKKCMRYISLMNSRHESRRQQRYIIRSQLIGRCFFDLKRELVTDQKREREKERERERERHSDRDSGRNGVRQTDREND